MKFIFKMLFWIIFGVVVLWVIGVINIIRITRKAVKAANARRDGFTKVQGERIIIDVAA